MVNIIPNYIKIIGVFSSNADDDDIFSATAQKETGSDTKEVHPRTLHSPTSP